MPIMRVLIQGEFEDPSEHEGFNVIYSTEDNYEERRVALVRDYRKRHSLSHDERTLVLSRRLDLSEEKADALVHSGNHISG